MVIDRSPRGVAQVERTCSVEIASGLLSVRCVAADDFALEPGEAAYDVAFAIRVGALDGQHPEAGRLVRARVRAALVPGWRLYVDGGDPLREVDLNDA